MLVAQAFLELVAEPQIVGVGLAPSGPPQRLSPSGETALWVHHRSMEFGAPATNVRHRRSMDRLVPSWMDEPGAPVIALRGNGRCGGRARKLRPYNTGDAY